MRHFVTDPLALFASEARMNPNYVSAFPQLTLEADGTPLSTADMYALTDVRVQQRLSLPTMCELTFSDPPGPLPGTQLLTPGTALRLFARGFDTPLFQGDVTALEYTFGPNNARAVRVRSYDPIHRLRKLQQVRAHAETTAEDLARELAADADLNVEAEESGPVWPLLIQHRQSDLELVQQVAERCGLYLTVREGTLHLITLRGIGEPVALALGDSLLEGRIELNSDPACRSVTASGWDPAMVQIHQGSASEPRTGRGLADEVDPARVSGDGRRALVG